MSDEIRAPAGDGVTDDTAAIQAGGRIKPGLTLRRRYHDVNGCPTCKRIREKHGGFGPPHDASENCESGRHEHCTCDVCF